ncbi:MAG: cbb3-type cytochrome c oxidase subunit 3 [Rhodospirillales bacterium]|nr:cbb3-type cytochrome c oxidase subunit 3 [Rhodospirillales bacterium]
MDLDADKGWLIVMGGCFVGVLYWAFRSGRPRTDDRGSDHKPPLR